MTMRAVIAEFDFPAVRPSARVRTIADMLDEDPGQIRRMLARGDLEGHRTGKRGVRIFLDSVAAWQKSHRVGGERVEISVKSSPPALKPAVQAAHRQAVAHLRRLGLV